jgi:hypothetical protein
VVSEPCSALNVPAEQLESLFDALTDVVFFVKDADGRYTHANQTLVRRLRLTHRSDVVGRHVTELFPPGMAASYAAQDQRVLAGERIDRHLEVHVFDNLGAGWCLTSKQPLIVDGRIRRVFQLTPHQALTKIRIEAAMYQLRGTTPIGAISMACGFSDQSALARQFKAIVGVPPSVYRAICQDESAPGNRPNGRKPSQ